MSKARIFFFIENRTFWDYLLEDLMFTKFLEVSIDENNFFNIILRGVKEKKTMNNLILNIRNYEDMGIEIIVFVFYWFLFSF